MPHYSVFFFLSPFIMIEFTKFTLCSFLVANWVVSVPALYLEPRAPSQNWICNGLAKMRVVQGSKVCANKNNAFNYGPGSSTLIQGPVSGGPEFRCGKESYMPALHCTHYTSILDHLLELSLIAKAVETDICTPLLADPTKKTNAERKEVLMPIIAAANNADYNLFMVPAEVDLFVSWEMILMQLRQELSHTLFRSLACTAVLGSAELRL